MDQFSAVHWDLIKNSNDENVDPYDLVKKFVKQSANDDDQIVKNFFDHSYKGKFLVLGGNDGRDQSLHLLESGWQGFYVEPDPFACSKLIENTQKYQQQVHILNGAVYTSREILRLDMCMGASQISSVIPQWTERHIEKFKIKNSNMITIWTPTLTLHDILRWSGYDIDYFQTDLEGIDIDVIESVDWSQLPNCKMICTEAGPAVLKQLCQQGDFMLTEMTQTNSFYKKKSFVLNDKI